MQFCLQSCQVWPVHSGWGFLGVFVCAEHLVSEQCWLHFLSVVSWIPATRALPVAQDFILCQASQIKSLQWTFLLCPEASDGQVGREGSVFSLSLGTASGHSCHQSSRALMCFHLFLQRGLHHHRPLLGHQFRPARFFHSILALEPRE